MEKRRVGGRPGAKRPAIGKRAGPGAPDSYSFCLNR